MKHKINPKSNGGGILDLKNNFLSPLKNKKGFTLAEVLITLVVIGIIAAITIPTITASHRKEEVETRLKKFYTAFYNAHHIEIANGNTLFDNVEVTGSGGGTGSNGISEWFLKNIIEKHMNVAQYKSTVYVKVPGKNYYTVMSNVYYYTDGSMSYGAGYLQSAGNYACISTTYDVNGSKGPDKIGKDRFKMIFCEGGTPEYEEYSEKRYGGRSSRKINYGDIHKEALNNCKNGDNNTDWAACFYLIKNNGFKIPNDYPYTI